MKKSLILIFIFCIFSIFLVSAEADIINPEIIIESPSNNFNTTDTNLDVNYAVSDDVAVGSCWYSDNSGTIIILNNCEDITTAIWPVGNHDVKIWVNDSSGNENFSSISFKIETPAPAQEILFKNFIPTEFNLGDVQFNIQVQNKKTIPATNLIASVSGKGFLTYNTLPVDLDPEEKGYILVSGNFKEAGIITLKIIIDNKIFYQNATVIDSKNATAQEIERLKEEEEKRNLLANISIQLDELKENYNILEADLEQKTEDNFDISKINFNDLNSYIKTTETAILEGNADKANINIKLAIKEYNNQKTKLDKAKSKSIITIIKENALVFSALAGAVIAFFALYELLKKKSEKVINVAKKVVIRKKDEEKKE